MNKFFVFGYLGSGINHLKWLILLSDSLKFNSSCTRNLNDKVHLIETDIYSVERTYYTWLDIEKKFKKLTRDCDVSVEHNVWEEKQYFEIIDRKSIFLDRLPADCLKHYFAIQNNLNAVSTKHFLWSVHLNSQTIKKCLPTLLVLDGSFLENKVLSKDIINSIEKHLDIKINYEAANYVHGLWYDRSKKAESDFLNDVSVLYKERIQ